MSALISYAPAPHRITTKTATEPDTKGVNSPGINRRSSRPRSRRRRRRRRPVIRRRRISPFEWPNRRYMADIWWPAVSWSRVRPSYARSPWPLDPV